MALKTEERGRVRVYACRSSACDNNNKAWLLRCFNAAISALLDAILVFFSFDPSLLLVRFVVVLFNARTCERFSFSSNTFPSVLSSFSFSSFFSLFFFFYCGNFTRCHRRAKLNRRQQQRSQISLTHLLLLLPQQK